MSYKELALEVTRALAAMSCEQRVHFYQIVLESYCPRCGKIDENCKCEPSRDVNPDDPFNFRYHGLV